MFWVKREAPCIDDKLDHTFVFMSQAFWAIEIHVQGFNAREVDKASRPRADRVAVG